MKNIYETNQLRKGNSNPLEDVVVAIYHQFKNDTSDLDESQIAYIYVEILASYGHTESLILLMLGA